VALEVTGEALSKAFVIDSNNQRDKHPRLDVVVKINQ
jgi:hypothetical protein